MAQKVLRKGKRVGSVSPGISAWQLVRQNKKSDRCLESLLATLSCIWEQWPIKANYILLISLPNPGNEKEKYKVLQQILQPSNHLHLRFPESCKHIHNRYYSSFPSAAINNVWGQVGGEGTFTAARRYSFHISPKYREGDKVLFHAPTSPD